jgi:hypothetical protein
MTGVPTMGQLRRALGRDDPSELLAPVVVDSSGRSGTTMTMALLASSAAVAMDREHPYEHCYLGWISEWSALADSREWDLERWNGGTLAWRQVGAPGDGLIGPPPWLPRRLWDADGDGDTIGRRLLRAAWREFSDQAIGRTRRDLGAARVRYHAEKGTNVSRLRELSPFAVRGVMLHRDPRDVWLSIQAFDRARGFYGFGRLAGESEDEWFERFLAAQVERSHALLAQRGRADSLLLAYEDLVTRPDAVAARLGAWLELELDPAAPARDLADHADHSTSASPAASIGRWRRELPAQLGERFASAMGAELRELGYEA